MGTTIELLMLFIFLQWLIRISLMRLTIHVWGIVLLILAVMLATYDWALSNNWVILSRLISQPPIIEDVAIVLCLEALLFLAYIILAPADKRDFRLQQEQSLTFYGNGITRMSILFKRLTASYPGVVALVVPALLQVWLFYCLPAADYIMIHCVAMGITVAVIAGGTTLLRRLFPNPEMRKELLFLCTLFILLLVTLALNDTRKAIPEIPHQQDSNALVVVGTMTAVCLAGWIVYRLRRRFIRFFHLNFKQQTF